VQYEKYELKIQKIESFFKFIFRHLGMVITVSSLIVATTVGLLAAKGTVMESDGALPTEVFYGETFRYEAKAFMSEVSYEYSPAGAEAWTQDVPLVPGEYQVRAVAKATFGYRYGEPARFCVKPKPIQVSIVSSEVPYGDEPRVTSNDLVYADKIEGASFTYNENRSHAEIASVLIRDENGADITAFYEITTTGRDIYTVRRRVKFTVEDASKIYDGTPLTSAQYQLTEGSLAAGDRLEVSFGGTLTDVGRVQNAASYTMLNAAGENVTDFYDISATAGYLEVLRREVAIKTHDLTVVYDATAHAAKAHEFTSEQTLAAGHTLVADGWTELVEIETRENRFSTHQVLDAAGNDVTANYALDITWGTLTVTKREILLSTTSPDARYYNGTPLSYNGLQNDGLFTVIDADILLDGHTFEPVEWAEQLNAGTAPNTITDFRVVDEGGEDVSRYYGLSPDCVWGTLEVKPIPLTVTTGNYSGEYDGLDHATDAGVDLSYDAALLLSGHRLEVIERPSIKNVKDNGENAVRYTIFCGNEDVTANYDVTEQWGTIEISKKAITVSSYNIEYTYDGTEKWNAALLNPPVLLGGDEIYVTAYTKVQNVSDSGKQNALTYKIENGGEDVSENYDVTTAWGTVTVSPCEYTLTTKDQNWTYDGSSHTYFGYVADAVTANGHRIEVLVSSSVKDYTPVAVDNEFDDYKILDAQGKDVTENYRRMGVTWGKLSVEKCPYTLKTPTEAWTYDGTEHASTENYTAVAITNNGHRIVVTRSTTVKNYTPTAINNEFLEYRIVDGQGNDVTENYICEGEAYGTLRMNRRLVLLRSLGAQKVYDGTPLTCLDWVYNVSPANSKYEFLEHHTVRVDGMSITEPTENGYNELTFTVWEGDEEVTDNYQISQSVGSLVITKRPITIITGSYNGVYDAEYHSSNTHTVGGDGLVLDHVEIVPTLTARRLNVGTTKNGLNAANVKIMSGDEDKTYCYEITVEEGDITVTRRHVIILSNSAERHYDGTDLSNQGWSYHVSSPYQLVTGHNLSVSESSSILYVGETENVFTSYRIVDSNGRSVSGWATNYELVLENGTLTVTKRPITVTPVILDPLTYDGTDQSWRNELTATNIPLVDYFWFNPNTTELRDATSYGIENKMEWDIFDAYGNSVKDNYEWGMILWQMVIIERRQITFHYSSPDDFTYDGRNHANETELTVEGLPTNNVLRLQIRSKTPLRDATATPIVNKVDFCIQNIDTGEVFDLDTLDKNFVFDAIEWDEVSIAKRVLTFRYSSPEDFIYDSTDHSIFTTLSVDGLPMGGVLSLEIIGMTPLKNVLWVNGQISAIRNEVVFYIFNAETGECFGDMEEYALDKNFTYEAIVWDTVLISPKEIVVTTQSYRKMYDGNDHSEESWNVPSAVLCARDAFGDLVRTRIKNVWDSGENIIQYKIYCDGEDVTANYKVVEARWGTIEISKRPLKLGSHSDTFEYDGNTHYYHYSDEDILRLDGTSLADHDFFTNDSGKGFRNVKDSGTNILTFEIRSSIIGDEGVDMADNYEITYEWGTVTVTPRYVAIKTESKSWSYDGEEHSHGGIVFLRGCSMVDGEELRAKDGTLTVIRDYGKIANVFEIEVIGADPENYEIDVTGYGNLVIARAVKIYLYRQVVEYDGVERTIDPAKYVLKDIEGGMTGQIFTLEAVYMDNGLSMVNVGEYWSSDLTVRFTVTENGEDVTDLYYVTVEDYEAGGDYAVLVITKRTVVVHTKSQSKPYDGKPLMCMEYYISEGSFVSGHQHNIGSIITGYLSGEVESGYNLISVDEFGIWDADGNEVLDNYDVTFVPGKLEITPKN